MKKSKGERKTPACKKHHLFCEKHAQKNRKEGDAWVKKAQKRFHFPFLGSYNEQRKGLRGHGGRKPHEISHQLTRESQYRGKTQKKPRKGHATGNKAFPYNKPLRKPRGGKGKPIRGRKTGNKGEELYHSWGELSGESIKREKPNRKKASQKKKQEKKELQKGGKRLQVALSQFRRDCTPREI